MFIKGVFLYCASLVHSQFLHPPMCVYYLRFPLPPKMEQLILASGHIRYKLTIGNLVNDIDDLASKQVLTIKDFARTSSLFQFSLWKK